MKYEYNTPVILIRKKQVGENSIEEIAYRLGKDLDIPVISVPCYSTRIKNLFMNILFVKKIKAPIVHVITPSEAYLLPFIKGKKVITYHDLGTVFAARNKLYKFIRFMLQVFPSNFFANQITFVSEQTKREWLLATKSKVQDNLHVVYNAYDSRLKPNTVNFVNEKFRILQIGTAKRKNLLLTIQACKGLDVKLVIIGKMNEEQLCEIGKSSIEYENYVDMTYEEVVQQYAKCDLVCFPTRYEGFGVPLIEANVMQKPIIAGDIPVLHEIGNGAAYFVNPDSVAELRNAIVMFIENSDIRNDYILAGKQNAQRFEHSYISKRYSEIYSM